MPQRLLHKLSTTLKKPEFAQDPGQTHRVIVECQSRGADRISNYVQDNQGRVHKELKVFPALVVELSYEAIQDLTVSNQVKRIWYDSRVQALLNVAVPVMGGMKAQESGFTGKGMTAAIIDTGIYPHPDLASPENRIIGWNDLVNGKTEPYDDNGHGTHVAGIIAGNGRASNGRYKGVAPEASLVGVKALDDSGSGNTSDIITALEWCIDNRAQYNIKAINMSLGSAAQDSYRSDPLCRAVTAAWNSGMVVCVAAGNSGPDAQTINSPGITPTVLTIGNFDDKRTIDPADDQLSESSSRGPTIDNIAKPDILAPGTGIVSLRVPMGYRALTGTSMATGFATGSALLVLEKNPSFRPNQVKQELARNARNMNLETTMQGAGALQLNGLFEESSGKSARFSLENLGQYAPYAMLMLIPVLFGF
ncbi:serine protease AprX [Hydrogenispora ethanolica]|uniref:Serine protease AprX n=1 Tax=Hydrogenispora ethanolica TaxID=1082276 RepID=A0A4R1RWS8_HYDET|nr:S8 family peptidase [Hydrogenispora ethanolica]TCL70914.1 serine protease AprX [Hydrogenispora ethanolica]